MNELAGRACLRPADLTPTTDFLSRTKRAKSEVWCGQHCRGSPSVREIQARRREPPAFFAKTGGSRPVHYRENIDTPRAFRLTMAAMPMNRPALAESRLSIKPGSIAFFATPWMSA